LLDSILLQRLSSLMGHPNEEHDELIPSAVFGPTCDGLDQMCSLDTTLLPRCTVGEWLYWDNQGAYTHTASFVFNGYTHLPQKTYCVL
jgi:diaminopimelate decarboxylase